MRKIKELLLFIALLIMTVILFLIVLGLKADMCSNNLKFIGIENYIRMFFYDKTFVKALLNTILPPAIVSFLLVCVFAVVAFIFRKKIKVPRWVFYLGSMFISTIASLIYIVYTNSVFFGVSTVFNALYVQNVLISLYVGISTAFVFWILELIVDIIKNFRRKKKGN